MPINLAKAFARAPAEQEAGMDGEDDSALAEALAGWDALGDLPLSFTDDDGE